MVSQAAAQDKIFIAKGDSKHEIWETESQNPFRC